MLISPRIYNEATKSLNLSRRIAHYCALVQQASKADPDRQHLKRLKSGALSFEPETISRKHTFFPGRKSTAKSERKLLQFVLKDVADFLEGHPNPTPDQLPAVRILDLPAQRAIIQERPDLRQLAQKIRTLTDDSASADEKLDQYIEIVERMLPQADASASAYNPQVDTAKLAQTLADSREQIPHRDHRTFDRAIATVLMRLPSEEWAPEAYQRLLRSSGKTPTLHTFATTVLKTCLDISLSEAKAGTVLRENTFTTSLVCAYVRSHPDYNKWIQSVVTPEIISRVTEIATDSKTNAGAGKDAAKTWADTDGSKLSDRQVRILRAGKKLLLGVILRLHLSCQESDQTPIPGEIKELFAWLQRRVAVQKLQVEDQLPCAYSVLFLRVLSSEVLNALDPSIGGPLTAVLTAMANGTHFVEGSSNDYLNILLDEPNLNKLNWQAAGSLLER